MASTTMMVLVVQYLINKDSICGSTCTKACEKQQYAEHPPKLEPRSGGGPPERQDFPILEDALHAVVFRMLLYMLTHKLNLC